MPLTLIGRDAVRAALDRAAHAPLDAPLASAPPVASVRPPWVVVLRGEPGIGLTSTLRDASARWLRVGWDVVHLPAATVGRALPHTTPSEHGRPASLEDAWAALRAHRAGVHQGVDQDTDAEVVPAGYALLVDDAQELDATTAESIAALTTRPTRAPLALLLVQRAPGVLVPALQRLVDATLRVRQGVVLDLERLPQSDATELARRVLDGAPLSESVAAWLEEQAAGVPGFIEALLHHARDRGALVLDGGVWTWFDAPEHEQPPSVRLMAQERLAALSAEACAQLGLLALHGRRVQRDVAVHLLRHTIGGGERPSAATAQAALDDLVASGLLLAADAPQRTPLLRFAHEQYRRTLADALPAPTRRQMHGVIAVVLAAQADAASQVMRIVRHAELGDDAALAASWKLTAAEQALDHGHRDAARQLIDDALRALREQYHASVDRSALDTTVLQGHLLQDAATQDALPGVRRREALAEALEHHPQASARVRWQVQMRLAELSQAAGQRPAALQHVAGALLLSAQVDALAERDTCLRAAALELGRPSGDPANLLAPIESCQRAERLLRRALELTPPDATPQRLRIELDLAAIAWRADDHAGAHAALDDIARRWRLHGDLSGELTALIARAYRRDMPQRWTATAASESNVSFLEEIRRLRELERRRRSGAPPTRSETLALLSISLYCRTHGWLEIARQRADQALRWARDAHDLRLQLLALTAVAEAALAAGQRVVALEAAQGAQALIASNPDRVSASVHDAADAAYVAALLSFGDLERALTAARERHARAEAGGQPVRVAAALAQHAEVLLRCDQLPAAQAAAEQILVLTRDMQGSLVADVQALLVLAGVSLQRAQWRDALDRVMAAIGLFEARDLPHVQLRVALYLTQQAAMAHLDRSADADASARRAMDLIDLQARRFEDIGWRTEYLRNEPHAVAAQALAGAWVAREDVPRSVHAPDAALALESAGASANGSTDATNAASPLTARETDVVRLVASGSSNRDIADALFISEKTVARHLTNIFGKLAVESRTQAAAWAFRHGVV